MPYPMIRKVRAHATGVSYKCTKRDHSDCSMIECHCDCHFTPCLDELPTPAPVRVGVLSPC